MPRLALIALALLLPVAAVTYWSLGTAPPKADFTFINRGQILSLDPDHMSWLQDLRVGYALWEGLYELDPRTLEPTLGVADRVTISEQGTVYTFHIRPGAGWSDGSKVTSRDFVFAWRRMLEQPADYTYLFYYIRGAEEYEKSFKTPGPANDARFAAVGIAAPSDQTLVVTLKHPLAFFPQLCAFPAFFPLHEASMRPFVRRDAITGRITYDPAFTRPPHLVTNGPFFLQTWEFKKELRLRKNPYYWDRAHVRSNTIQMIDALDPQWAYLQYNRGGVDWLSDVDNNIAAELLAQHRPDLHVFPGFGTYFYSLNCQPKLNDGSSNPLADVRVRQALDMAINKSQIVRIVTRLGELPARTFIPPGVFPGYVSPHGFPFDAARARRLLAEAGYPGGKGLQISIIYDNDGQHGDIAQNVHRQWLTNLGVDAQLRGSEKSVFRGALRKKDYTVARASWYGDYEDVSTFTDKYRTGGGNNDSGWSSPQYDRLCEEAEVETNPAKRLALYTQAEQLLCDQVPIIPLYFPTNSYLFRDNVHGIPLNPREMVNLKSVYVTEHR